MGRIGKRATNSVKACLAAVTPLKRDKSGIAGAARPKSGEVSDTAPERNRPLSPLEALPDGALLKILGFLPHQDVAEFEAVSKSCRAIGQQVWTQASRTPLPCHVPPGPGAVKRGLLQQAQVLQGFPDGEDDDDPLVLIGWIGDKTERARVAQYGLLARLEEQQWLEPKYLKLILGMCTTAKRIDEACVWLGRLIKGHPEARESICSTVIESHCDEALVRTCLASGFKSWEVADALVARDLSALVLGAMPLDASEEAWQRLAARATQAGAVASVEVLLSERPSVKVKVAEVLNGYCEHSAAIMERLFDLLIRFDGLDLHRWETFLQPRSYILSRAKVLHRLGVDFNRIDSTGHTFLATAQSADLYGFLLDHGADPCAIDINGATALHLLATHEACAQFCGRVVARGVDINAVDAAGRTPLHLTNNVRFMTAAVAHGGNLLLRDGQGHTALVTLMRHDNTMLGVAAALLFLANGGDAREITSRLQVRPSCGLSNLGLRLLLMPKRQIASTLMEHVPGASDRGIYLLVALAAQRGCTFGRSNHCGQTVVHFIAANASEAGTIALLRRCGAPIDREDFYGYTPLFYAAARRKVDTCVALLEAGALAERISEGAMGRALGDLKQKNQRQCDDEWADAKEPQSQSQAGSPASQVATPPPPPSLKADLDCDQLENVLPTLRQAQAKMAKSAKEKKLSVESSDASKDKAESFHDLVAKLIQVIDNLYHYYYHNQQFDLTGED